MARNTEEERWNKDGNTLLFDMSEFLNRFRRLMENDEWDEFKLIWRSREILLDFARTLCALELSVYQVAKDIAGSRKSFLDWVCLGTELDGVLREQLSEHLPEGSVVTEVTLVFDKPHLLIRHTVPRNEDEIGFERYIERCRREHESIHPEVDRQLRLYRSTRNTATPFVLDSRRFRSKVD